MLGNAYSLSGTDVILVRVNLAASLIGGAFNSFFFGLVAMQTAYYWQHCWKNDRDKLYLRCLVVLVIVLTVLHMVFLMYTAWNILVQSHAGASGSSTKWSIGAQSMVNTMGILAVHTFYLNRLWTLSQNRLFVGILGVLMLEVFALGMYISVHTFTLKTPTPRIPAGIINAETALSVSLAVTDVTMTTSLVTLFLRLTNTGMKSERLVKRLIFYTLTTGMLTAVCTVVAFITVLKFPETTIPAVLSDLGASLYACSFLSSLNARQGLRGKLIESSDGLKTGSAPMSSFPRFAALPFSRGTFASPRTAANGTRTPMQVQVERNATVHSHSARSIGERLRIQDRPSYEASPSHYDSESSLPSTKGFDARESDPGLGVRSSLGCSWHSNVS